MLVRKDVTFGMWRDGVEPYDAQHESRSLLLASAAIMVLAAGCSGGSGSGTLKLEKTSIVIDAFPAIDSAGLYIAQMKGLFAAQA